MASSSSGVPHGFDQGESSSLMPVFCYQSVNELEGVVMEVGSEYSTMVPQSQILKLTAYCDDMQNLMPNEKISNSNIDEVERGTILKSSKVLCSAGQK